MAKKEVNQSEKGKEQKWILNYDGARNIVKSLTERLCPSL